MYLLLHRHGRHAHQSRTRRRGYAHGRRRLAGCLALYAILGAFRGALASGIPAAAAAAAESSTLAAAAESKPQGRHRSSRPGDEVHDELSALEMVRWLDEVEVHVMVNVVLVGFVEKGVDGSVGEGFVELDAAPLRRHLDELVRGLSADSNGGVPIAVVDQGRENALSRLRLHQETLFEVSHALPSLSKQITSAVESAMLTATSRGDSVGEQRQGQTGAEGATAAAGVAGIPRTAVDDAIRGHFNPNISSYSLYIIHPNAKGRYEYVHDSPGDAAAQDGAGASPGDEKDAQHKRIFPEECGYVGWVGQYQRYAWLDLGAYVSSGWGPQRRALGVVSPSTLPNLVTAAEAVAVSPGKRGDYARLYPELAALVHRTASQLMVPPLLFTPTGLSEGDYRPLPYPPVPPRWSDYGANSATRRYWQLEKTIVVRLFFLCDASPCPAGEAPAWSELAELLGVETEGGRNQQGGETLMPRVVVERKEYVLMEHPMLATGLQQALQVTRGDPSSEAPGSMSLASAELRRWLRLFLDGKGRRRRDDRAEGSEGDDGEDDARVVPVFVLILDADAPVLLDHSVRSTAFPDMVVSVKSRGDTVVDSGFQYGGRNVMIRGVAVKSVEEHEEGVGRNSDSGVLRDTVASVAQLLWGALPRTLSWDPLAETLGTDFLWATGASLHTPLSPHSSLTFPERDAYLRTYVLRRVDAALGAARDVLEQAAAVEPRLALVLHGGDHARAEGSWHRMQDSLHTCLDELAVHHHKSAVRYAGALEDHVATLGGALSRGYAGSAGYRAACDCEAPDEFVDVWESSRASGVSRATAGDKGYLVLVDLVCGMLLATGVVCVALAAYLRFFRAPAGLGVRGRFAGRSRKHKFS